MRGSPYQRCAASDMPEARYDGAAAGADEGHRQRCDVQAGVTLHGEVQNAGPLE